MAARSVSPGPGSGLPGPHTPGLEPKHKQTDLKSQRTGCLYNRTQGFLISLLRYTIATTV